jgi:DNA repair exonuclease SbcCD nuclease subunit
MKLILLSDPHITSINPVGRIDNLLLASKTKLEYVFLQADRNNANILIAGDTFNRPRDVSALFMFVSIMYKYPKVKVYAVKGQHDTYARNQNVVTNMGILEKSRMVTILNKVPQYSDFGIALLYGASWKDSVPVPEKKLQHSDMNILVVHAPVTMKKFNLKFNHSSAQRFIRKHKGYDCIIVGDIHRDFIYRTKDGRLICNTGPMMRLETSESIINHKPRLYIYDTTTKEIESKIIPHIESSKVFRKNIGVAKRGSGLGNIYINSKQTENIDIMHIIEKLIIKAKNGKAIREIIEDMKINV